MFMKPGEGGLVGSKVGGMGWCGVYAKKREVRVRLGMGGSGECEPRIELTVKMQ